MSLEHQKAFDTSCHRIDTEPIFVACEIADAAGICFLKGCQRRCEAKVLLHLDGEEGTLRICKIHYEMGERALLDLINANDFRVIYFDPNKPKVDGNEPEERCEPDAQYFHSLEEVIRYAPRGPLALPSFGINLKIGKCDFCGAEHELCGGVPPPPPKFQVKYVCVRPGKEKCREEACAWFKKCRSPSLAQRMLNHLHR